MIDRNRRTLIWLGIGAVGFVVVSVAIYCIWQTVPGLFFGLVAGSLCFLPAALS